MHIQQAPGCSQRGGRMQSSIACSCPRAMTETPPVDDLAKAAILQTFERFESQRDGDSMCRASGLHPGRAGVPSYSSRSKCCGVLDQVITRRSGWGGTTHTFERGFERGKTDGRGVHGVADLGGDHGAGEFLSVLRSHPQTGQGMLVSRRRLPLAGQFSYERSCGRPSSR